MVQTANNQVSQSASQTLNIASAHLNSVVASVGFAEQGFDVDRLRGDKEFTGAIAHLVSQIEAFENAVSRVGPTYTNGNNSSFLTPDAFIALTKYEDAAFNARTAIVETIENLDARFEGSTFDFYPLSEKGSAAKDFDDVIAGALIKMLRDTEPETFQTPKKPSEVLAEKLGFDVLANAASIEDQFDSYITGETVAVEVEFNKSHGLGEDADAEFENQAGGLFDYTPREDSSWARQDDRRFSRLREALVSVKETYAVSVDAFKDFIFEKSNGRFGAGDHHIPNKVKAVIGIAVALVVGGGAIAVTASNDGPQVDEGSLSSTPTVAEDLSDTYEKPTFEAPATTAPQATTTSTIPSPDVLVPPQVVENAVAEDVTSARSNRPVRRATPNRSQAPATTVAPVEIPPTAPTTPTTQAPVTTAPTTTAPTTTAPTTTVPEEPTTTVPETPTTTIPETPATTIPDGGAEGIGDLTPTPRTETLAVVSNGGPASTLGPIEITLSR